eukprot:TRINITY_DN123_c0_g1_i1.p1 TRINITY_DN123_c0_g1~~TRINITY_DN123_c0_g1_i1.p1  ORF type:complete len:702 (-),score=180.78 TRINITY_DN123_c0_g1_i1:118-1947(-)
MRLSRRKHEEQAELEVKRENQRLVERLCLVMRESEERQRQLSGASRPQNSASSTAGTLNLGHRRKVAQQIDKDNKALLDRLLRAGPTLATRSQLSARYQVHTKIVKERTRLKRTVSKADMVATPPPRSNHQCPRRPTPPWRKPPQKERNLPPLQDANSTSGEKEAALKKGGEKKGGARAKAKAKQSPGKEQARQDTPEDFREAKHLAHQEVSRVGLAVAERLLSEKSLGTPPEGWRSNVTSPRGQGEDVASACQNHEQEQDVASACQTHEEEQDSPIDAAQLLPSQTYEAEFEDDDEPAQEAAVGPGISAQESRGQHVEETLQNEPEEAQVTEQHHDFEETAQQEADQDAYSDGGFEAELDAEDDEDAADAKEADGALDDPSYSRAEDDFDEPSYSRAEDAFDEPSYSRAEDGFDEPSYSREGEDGFDEPSYNRDFEDDFESEDEAVAAHMSGRAMQPADSSAHEDLREDSFRAERAGIERPASRFSADFEDEDDEDDEEEIPSRSSAPPVAAPTRAPGASASDDYEDFDESSADVDGGKVDPPGPSAPESVQLIPSENKSMASDTSEANGSQVASGSRGPGGSYEAYSEWSNEFEEDSGESLQPPEKT